MVITKRQMEIVTVAIAVIAQEGYEKLTTKNLASRLGVTDASLYKHFDSKLQLIKMILSYFEHISSRVIHEINMEDFSPLDRIRRFVHDRYRMFEEQPDLAMVMFSEELFKHDRSFQEDLLSIMHIHRDEVITYIKEGQQLGQINPSLDPTHIFRIVVGSMRLTVTQWNLSNHSFPLSTEGHSLIETIINMIEVKG